MGFRSTLVSQDSIIKWPKWFMRKWDSILWFGTTGVFASKAEYKAYGLLEPLPKDVQKALRRQWKDISDFQYILFHEDGTATRITVREDGIDEEDMEVTKREQKISQ